MSNVVSDKQEWCKEHNISIKKEEWNSSKCPGILVTDQGTEYTSSTFEQLAELGIKIVNLPVYRPELKGSVEKFFSIIQDLFRPYLKGNKLTDLPEYNRSIQTKNQTERILSLSTLYDIYLPSEMSVEIYSKLYLALVRSLQKKYTKAAIQQSYQNHNSIIGRESRGIIGGSDSFSIIGRSGIGKTSAINRAISIVSNHQIIKFDKPAIRIIPCLKVECPWDASVKSMLLSILREVDQYLGTTYFINASKKRITTDMLIGMVAQVSMQHIGILIIDEIQNCVGSRNGRGLVAMLTQLINSSGISIGLIGTPETLSLFESAFQLARRSLGLHR